MSSRLWGGRFSKDVDASVAEWTESVTIDTFMVDEDLWGSQSHVSMLAIQKIIPFEDAKKILDKLHELENKFKDGSWALSKKQDDVHMNVEAYMLQTLGLDSGGKMHTCRSRNDQVILDCKLHSRELTVQLREKVLDIVDTLLTRAGEYLDDVMVSYTHVQHAQPISIAYWLTHYAAVFLRDLERLKRAYDITDQNPLGSGAISGTSFPIDRNLTTKLMGFQSVHEHCMDATSSRDFMLEVLSAYSILMTTFSRFAEELILWSSYEFQTVTMDDGLTMGSSMMPQKKNPGVAELLRGRSGRVNGLLMAGFTLMKGLPSGYNRDFHEDKEILFEAGRLINSAAEVVAPLVKTTQLNKERMHELAYGNFATATELANYLVKSHNLSFRKAHHVIGSLVGELSRSKRNFSDFDFCIQHFKKEGIVAPDEEIKRMLDPKQVMLSYRSQGGTSPESVSTMLTKFKQELQSHRQTFTADLNRIRKARQAARNIAKAALSVDSLENFAKLVESESKQQ